MTFLSFWFWIIVLGLFSLLFSISFRRWRGLIGTLSRILRMVAVPPTLLFSMFFSGMLFLSLFRLVALAFLVLQFLFLLFFVVFSMLFSIGYTFVITAAAAAAAVGPTLSHPAIHNDNFLHGGWFGPFQFHIRGHFVDDVHAFDDLTKHNMLPIQMWRGGQGNKKLTPIGILALVGHAEQTCLVMRYNKRFIGKGSCGSQHGMSTGPIKVFKIPALHHELGDNSMKDGAPKGRYGFGRARTTRCRTERGKILAGLGAGLPKQFQDDALRCLAGNGNLQETKMMVVHDATATSSSSSCCCCSHDGSTSASL